MSKPKLTPWFPGSVKPVRDGTYLVKRDMCGCEGDLMSTHRLDFRNGHWRYTARERTAYPGSMASMQGHRCFWRGLASDPKAA